MALSQLHSVQQIIANTQLTQVGDRRLTNFGKGEDGLDSGAIYQLLKSQGNPNDNYAKFTWKNAAPPRVQMFMWLLGRRRIQCRTVLFKKHILQDTICEICHAEEESPEHIISGCTLGRAFWSKLNMHQVLGMPTSDLHLLSPPMGVPQDEFATFIALSCWQLWKVRNEAVFRNQTSSVDQVLAACKATALQWRPRFSRKKKPIVDQWGQVFEDARER